MLALYREHGADAAPAIAALVESRRL